MTSATIALFFASATTVKEMTYLLNLRPPKTAEEDAFGIEEYQGGSE